MEDTKIDAQKIVADSSEEFPQGSLWKHYKGGTYRIVTTCVDENSLEPLIIYQSIKYGTTWARSFKDWRENVSVSGAEVPRFVRVESSG